MTDLKKIDWVKWFIIALGVWFVIYPQPYKALVTLLVLLPLSTIIIHGVIGRRPSISTLLDGVLDNKSSFSPITHALCAMIPLGFRVFMDYDPENMLVMIGIGLASTFASYLLVLSTHKHADKHDDSAGLNYVIIGALLLFSSSTSMFAINCVYDNTEPHQYQVKVVDKYSSRASSKSGADYNLKVTSWKKHSEILTIEVPSEKYNSVEKGDEVKVHVRDGLFGVGWYYIE